jgi:hypothetical protein
MQPIDYITRARVPATLEPQKFGPWTIIRADIRESIPIFVSWVGFETMTMLCRYTTATMHKEHGEVVMEDSLRELRRHLPIWLHARGRILVTGLGLGCVVRGLLASPDVEHITVIEIDERIIRVVGKEFERNDRVRMIHGDALTVKLEDKFDFAWHDIWTEGNEHLQVLHVRLIKRFHPRCQMQGAWLLPRMFKRKAPEWMIG